MVTGEKDMARYDEVFADLQAKQSALLAVIAAHPEIADEVKAAWTTSPDEIAVGDPTDEARANALAAVLRQSEQVVGIEQRQVEQSLSGDDC
jgi:sarcosine oxidase gamma subunit